MKYTNKRFHEIWVFRDIKIFVVLICREISISGNDFHDICLENLRAIVRLPGSGVGWRRNGLKFNRWN